MANRDDQSRQHQLDAIAAKARKAGDVRAEGNHRRPCAPRQPVADLDEGGRLAGARDRLNGEVRCPRLDDVLRVLKNVVLKT